VVTHTHTHTHTLKLLIQPLVHLVSRFIVIYFPYLCHGLCLWQNSLVQTHTLTNTHTHKYAHTYTHKHTHTHTQTHTQNHNHVIHAAFPVQGIWYFWIFFHF